MSRAQGGKYEGNRHFDIRAGWCARTYGLHTIRYGQLCPKRTWQPHSQRIIFKHDCALVDSRTNPCQWRRCDCLSARAQDGCWHVCAGRHTEIQCHQLQRRRLDGRHSLHLPVESTERLWFWTLLERIFGKHEPLIFICGVRDFNGLMRCIGLSAAGSDLASCSRF